MDRSIFSNVSQDKYWNLKSYFGAEVHPLVTSGFLNQFTPNELRTADMTKNFLNFFDMADDFDRSSLDRIRKFHENKKMTLVVNTRLYRKQSLGAINHLDLAFHLTLDEKEKNSLLDFLSGNAKSVKLKNIIPFILEAKENEILVHRSLDRTFELSLSDDGNIGLSEITEGL